MSQEKARVFDLFATAKKSLYNYTCAHCQKAGTAVRPDKKFCSERCMKRSSRGQPRTRDCRKCGQAFKIVTSHDGNRRYCSRTCSRAGKAKQDAAWFAAHPEAMGIYNARRYLRRPNEEKNRNEASRLAIIAALGGKCCVCEVTNILWLEIDYKPTTRGRPFRHPRHRGFVLRHLQDFRLLCANHHRELTLSGRIEGTNIVQAMAPLERVAS